MMRRMRPTPNPVDSGGGEAALRLRSRRSGAALFFCCSYRFCRKII